MMSDALRVGIFLPTLRGGGAERNMLRLAEGLVARGMKITVVVADERGPLRDHVPADAAFVNLGARILALSLVPFIRWLRTRPVDVVIAAINGANVVALAGRSLSGVDVPIIVSERNTLSEWRTDGWSPDRRWIIPWLVRRLYPRAEAIVAVSQATADDLSNFTGIDGARIDVVANPVVGPALHEAAAQPVVTQGRVLESPVPGGPAASAGAPEEGDLASWMASGPTVITLGRLVSQKDHATLLEAFAAVRMKVPQARLVVVGDGPLRQRIIDKALAMGLGGHVWIVGFMANPYPLVVASDVMVLASKFEGLPTVLVEALALGVPVVATDAPGGTREVLGDGRWGTLVPVGDVPTLATALETALLQVGESQATLQPGPARHGAMAWQPAVAASVEPYLLDTVVEKWSALISRVQRGR